jgi:hypothetical protein
MRSCLHPLSTALAVAVLSMAMSRGNADASKGIVAVYIKLVAESPLPVRVGENKSIIDTSFMTLNMSQLSQIEKGPPTQMGGI